MAGTGTVRGRLAQAADGGDAVRLRRNSKQHLPHLSSVFNVFVIECCNFSSCQSESVADVFQGDWLIVAIFF